jgi:RNA polymerase sigma-70 factor (ECF subfamily)
MARGQYTALNLRAGLGVYQGVMAARRMRDDDSRRPRLKLVEGGRAGDRRDEDALLGAWLVGDDDAFGELVRRHQALVLAIVRRYAATPEDARDLAQRTFLKAFESARRLLLRRGRNAIPFKRWLVRVAVNLAKNHRRDAGRWTSVELEPERLASAALPAHEALERAQATARVRRAVLELPRRQREVLTLRLDAELPFAEIGEALGITENAAKVSFHLAARRLRAELGQEGA